MENFGLCAPIKEQLEAILHDYPGGQLLAEALQNAEDSKATTFDLILDARHHNGLDNRLSGPAFLLIDDGSGLGKREWRSLQNLNKSEKKNNPGEIGRYGMGSRSYFHYSDITLVASCGKYAGIDPLNAVSSHSRGMAGGWMLDVGLNSNEKSVSPLIEEHKRLFLIPEACKLGSNFNPLNKGAAFRLPLRRASEVKEGLGKEVPLLDAENMMNDWSKSLQDGRLLLFLTSVKKVSLWHWSKDSSSPKLLSKLEKSLSTESMFERLPQSLPLSAKNDCEELRTYLTKLTHAKRAELSKIHITEIKTSATFMKSSINQEYAEVCTAWIVAQKFDVLTNEVYQEFSKGSSAIPVIGIALPVDGSFLLGAAACFLPIGDMATHLPIHVNASFNVLKNRRDIWLPSASLGGDGDIHMQWARWNDILIRFALPLLWKEVLELLPNRLKSTTGTDIQDVIFSRLPNVSEMEGQKQVWKICAETVYIHLRDVCVLQHVRNGQIIWIPPSKAFAFHAPTTAFVAIQDNLKQAYLNCSAYPYHVVFLPSYIEQGMICGSGLRRISIQDFLSNMLNITEPHILSTPLLALAELADNWNPNDISLWFSKIESLEWVKIRQSVDKIITCDTRYTKLSHTFAPDQHEIEVFKVVQYNTAHLICPKIICYDSMCRTLFKWGMKLDLTWEDVEIEAKDIDHNGDINRATHLCKYLQQKHKNLNGNRNEVLERLKSVTFIPGHEPTTLDKKKLTSNIKLFASNELLPHYDMPVVWAVHPTAADDYSFGLFYNTLRPSILADQICTLSHYKMSVTEDLLLASERLDKFSSSKELQDVFYKLENIPWLPIRGDNKILKEPCYVVLYWDFSLSPLFGTPTDSWCELGNFLTKLGVKNEVPGKRLVEELANIASTKNINTMNNTLELNLARELARRCENDKSLQKIVSNGCFVPTINGSLQISSKVFIDDAAWKHDSTENNIELLHRSIGADEGRLLGCTSCRDELAGRCEDINDFDDTDFGQREKLADRISGLLHDYNQPIDVITEHYQNSDDAGAESLLFLLDYNNYPTESLVDNRALVLQEPALILASSQSLSDIDIKRIQSLGHSKKQGDFSSMGRFGIGINTLYHMTDTPVLLANNALHIFDPLQKAVSRGHENGKKFSCSSLSREGFHDMLKPFEKLRTEWPTIFRLPLRTSSSSEWKCKMEIWKNPEIVEQMLIQFYQKSNAEDMLVFSKHVRSVEFCKMNGCSQSMLAKITCQHITGSHDIMKSLPKSLDEMKIIQNNPRYNISNMDIQMSIEGTIKTSRWIISHALEGNEKLIDLSTKKFNSGFALLPHGASALRICGPKDSYVGRYCCQLPLGDLYVGSPILIHSFFDVTSSRKNIPLPTDSGDPSTSQSLWNKSVIEGPVAESLARLILHIRKDIANNVSANKSSVINFKNYFDLFELRSQNSTDLNSILRHALLQRLIHEAIYPVICEGNFRKWHSGPSVIVSTHKLDIKSIDFLVNTGLPLVYLPDSVLELFCNCAKGLKVIGPTCLSEKEMCTHLKSIDSKGKEILATDENLVNDMLKFAISSIKQDCIDLSHLSNVPLLLVKSKELRAFGDARPCFWDFDGLLPDNQNLFITKEQYEIFHINSPSRESLHKAAHSQIGISLLTPNDIVPFKNDLHTRNHVQSHSWWALFWKKIKQFKEQLILFDNWQVVKMITPDGVKMKELAQARICFSMHNTEPAWQQDICNIMTHCGFNILHTSDKDEKYQLDLLKDTIQSDESGVTHLLRSVTNAEWGNGSSGIEHRVKLLAYYSSRRKMSNDVVNTIRSMPIFLQSRKQFVDLSDRSKKYICLQKDQTAKIDRSVDLMSIHIPSICFLAFPSDAFYSLYKEVGIHMMSTSDYVVSYICPHLPYFSKQGAKILIPVLYTLQSWLITGEDATLRTRIMEAAKKLPFVLSGSGKISLAKDLIDPDLPITKHYAEELSDYLPTPYLYKHLNLLKILGLNSSLMEKHILLCSIALDKLAGENIAQQDDIQQKSIFLLQQICSSLSSIWLKKKSGDEKILHCAMNFRIALVYPAWKFLQPDTLSQYVKDLAETSSTELRPSAMLSGMIQLAPITDLLLTSKVENIAWTQHSIFAWEKGYLQHKNTKYNFEDLIREYPSQISQKLKCFCIPSDLSLKSLSNHLKIISQVAPSPFYYSTQLRKHFNQIFQAMEKYPFSNENFKLEQLSNCTCVPLHIRKDASGKIHRDGIVNLTAPSRLFFRLPDTYEQHCMKQYLNEWPNGKEKIALSSCTTVAKVIGVRDSPDLNDWVNVLQEIGEAAAQKKLDPNEKKAAKFALTRVLLQLKECKDDNIYIDGLWLFNYTNKNLMKAEHLVWVDVESFKHRCEHGLKEQLGLSLASDHFVSNSSTDMDINGFLDLALLCKKSALRPLSEIVTEKCMNDPVSTEPGNLEQKLEMHIKSRMFADSHCACIHNAFDKQMCSQVHELLNSVDFRWVSSSLETILYTVNGTDEISIKKSEKNTFVFCQDCVLWIEHDILGSDDERKLLDEISTSMFCLLKKSLTHRNQQHSLFPNMLECYREGPDILPSVLERKGVRIELDVFENQPGSAIAISEHSQIKQSMLFIFDVGEIIAILGDKVEGIQRYQYAEVQCFENKQTLPEEDLGKRNYKILIGDKKVAILKHNDLYKITRNNPSHLKHSSDKEWTGENAQESEENQYNDLVKQLHQMELCDEVEYKKRARRLIRQWHPDKNIGHQKQAHKLFLVIRRHWDSYKGNKDFTWLGNGASDLDCTEHVSTTSTGVRNNHTHCEHVPESTTESHESSRSGWSWFDEHAAAVAEENVREESAVSEASRQKTIPLARPVKASTSKREFSFEKADAMWQCANAEIETSNALSTAYYYPGSVWHAQQAVEMMIKSLMFRTCGITEFELKGKGAHNLLSLFGRIEGNKDNWPVTSKELAFLSKAYFDARYPTGDMKTLPWNMYGLDDTEEAQQIVQVLKKWVINQKNINMPDSEDLDMAYALGKRSRPEQISLRPAAVKTSKLASSNIQKSDTGYLAPTSVASNLETPMKLSEISVEQLELQN